MDFSWIEVAGLVGVVLVISTGRVIDPVREYMRGFAHPMNPSRWIADVLSCSLCVGFGAGLVWGVVHSWSWAGALVFGGVVGMLSLVTDEVFGLVGMLSLRASRGAAMSPAPMVPRIPRRRIVAPGDDISEDEANVLLDNETSEADAWAVSAGPPMKMQK